MTSVYVQVAEKAEEVARAEVERRFRVSLDFIGSREHMTVHVQFIEDLQYIADNEEVSLEEADNLLFETYCNAYADAFARLKALAESVDEPLNFDSLTRWLREYRPEGAWNLDDPRACVLCDYLTDMAQGALADIRVGVHEVCVTLAVSDVDGDLELELEIPDDVATPVERGLDIGRRQRRAGMAGAISSATLLALLDGFDPFARYSEDSGYLDEDDEYDGDTDFQDSLASLEAALANSPQAAGRALDWYRHYQVIVSEDDDGYQVAYSQVGSPTPFLVERASTASQALKLCFSTGVQWWTAVVG